MGLIYNQIPGAFPWYDKLQKLNHYRRNCLDKLDYKLIAPKNAILPFQWRRPMDVTDITAWEIIKVNPDGEIDITENLAAIKTASLEGYDYFYYGGGALLLDGEPLSLGYGYYYSVITFSDNSKQYSEMFFIPEDSFNVEDTDINYLKLEWYNLAGDLDPFYYTDTLDGIPVFRNVCYLDAFVTSSEPVITEVTVKDGDDKDIPTFQKCVIPYKINLYLPDFLKLAVVISQLHDTINFTSANEVYQGQIDSITTQIQTDQPGCMSIVDVLFEQLLSVVNRACATNLVRAVPGTAFNYLTATLGDERITYDEGNLVLTDPILVGKTGYLIISEQDGGAPISFDDLVFDAVAGSVKITTPGYDIVANYHIFIFYNNMNPVLI